MRDMLYVRKVSRQDTNRIKAAAALLGVHMQDFVLDTLKREANRVLAEKALPSEADAQEQIAAG